MSNVSPAVTRPSAQPPPRRRSPYDRKPFILIWEISQACPLACRHCRADAILQRNPDELTTEEGKELLDQAAEMGVFVVVLSGGDPLSRDDLYELVRHGVDRGLRMSTIPAASDRLTRDVVAKLQEAGVAQMAVSLDAPRADIHDDFRGTPGAFAKTLEAARWARESGLPLQINSVLTKETWPWFDEMAELVIDLDPVFWEIFALVPVGRGDIFDSLDAREYEEAFEKIRDVAERVPFIVKVVEAPHYHRFCLEQARGAEGDGADADDRTPPMVAAEDGGPGTRPGGHPHDGPGKGRGQGAHPAGIGMRSRHPGTVGRAPAPVNAGKGFCFVSHVGEVYPSGFMPLSAGNVRETPLAELYRHSELFRSLRDPSRLEGKCGVCSYRAACGGSRSRAFALTGNPFAEDPYCAYEPPREVADRLAGRPARSG